MTLFERMLNRVKDDVDNSGGGGGEPNVIETVKVNGTALPVTEKAVDVPVPTTTSDLTNDSGFVTDTDVATAIQTELANSGDPYQTESDIDTALASYYTKTQTDTLLADKADTADLPTDLSDLTNTGLDPYATEGYVGTELANYYTQAQTNAKIAEAIDDVDLEHFHVVTVLPDVSVAEENHEYVLVTYAQDGTTILTEVHYLFYDGAYHQRNVQISLDGYATEQYVEDYVDANGGKIDSISVNGTAQTIDLNKNVDIMINDKEKGVLSNVRYLS